MNLQYVTYSEKELEEVRAIFIEYSEFLEIDLCFQNFEKELKTLHEVYSLPKGCIILAKDASQNVAGCIAVKPNKGGFCEMKRLYVRDSYKGQKLGRKLAEASISFAKEAGYIGMKLDTVPKLKEAIGLYRSLGFVETLPYVYNPLEEVLYFEKIF
jgi:putative acetyltransferase